MRRVLTAAVNDMSGLWLCRGILGAGVGVRHDNVKLRDGR